MKDLNEKKLRLLFVHNAIPEYRIAFWKELNNHFELKLYITNKGLEDKIYKLKNNKSNLDFVYSRDLQLKKMYLNSYDIVILPAVDSIKEFFWGIVIKNRCKRKLIYWSEKWESEAKYQTPIKKFKNLVHRIMIYYIAKGCDYCIASGTKSKEYLKNIGIDSDKIRIVIDSSTSPIVQNDINIKELYKIGENKKIILFLGRFIKRKGGELLINTIADQLEKLNAVLLMAGDGEEKEYYKQLAANNPNIIFTGMISPDIRRTYYEQSDIFVLPSTCYDGVVEAWGLTVNEALECGTPVIVSDIVGAGYDIVNKNNGIIFRFESPIELRSAIINILNNYNNYKRDVIQNNYKKYTIKEMALQFADVIKETSCEKLNIN